MALGLGMHLVGRQDVAVGLHKDVSGREERPPTPLTGTNRSRGRDAIHKGEPRRKVARAAPKVRLCLQRGAEVMSPTRQYCDRCIESPTRDDTALRKAAASVRTQEALAEWRRRSPEGEDPAVFRREVLPLIQSVPISRLIEVTGLSEAYCYRIRRGEIVPHLRHWHGLRVLAE